MTAHDDETVTIAGTELVLHDTSPAITAYNLEDDQPDPAWYAEIAIDEPDDGPPEDNVHILPFNQQVFRTLGLMVDLDERGHPWDEIARRGAVILLARPEDDGTPVRCRTCERKFTLMDGEPDWSVAGREDTTCPACTAAAYEAAEAARLAAAASPPVRRRNVKPPRPPKTSTP